MPPKEISSVLLISYFASIKNTTPIQTRDILKGNIKKQRWKQRKTLILAPIAPSDHKTGRPFTYSSNWKKGQPSLGNKNPKGNESGNETKGKRYLALYPKSCLQQHITERSLESGWASTAVALRHKYWVISGIFGWLWDEVMYLLILVRNCTKYSHTAWRTENFCSEISHLIRRKYKWLRDFKEMASYLFAQNTEQTKLTPPPSPKNPNHK